MQSEMETGAVEPVVVQDIWQPKLSHVLERTTHLFMKPDNMSDVSFLFKKSKGTAYKIYGHKVILGMSSPVFYQMFYNDQFSKPYKNDEIRMSARKHNFDHTAFFNFIKFLYTDNIEWTPLSMETVIGILHCSEFYDVPRVKTEAGKALQPRLKVDNVIFLLETALLFNDKDLAEKCWPIIDSEAKVVLELEMILDAKMETLFQIIRRDTLVVNESQVLDVCLKWSEKECERKGLDVNEENKRRVLDKIFLEIRFPLLPPLKIAEIVGSNLLTQKESLEMLLHMHCASETDLDKSKCLIPESPFKMKKRAEPRKILTAVRSQTISHPQLDGLERVLTDSGELLALTRAIILEYRQQNLGLE